MENIRRIGEVSKLLVDAGTIAITAFISPYRADRDEVREILEDGEFIEVYTECAWKHVNNVILKVFIKSALW